VIDVNVQSLIVSFGNIAFVGWNFRSIANQRQLEALESLFKWQMQQVLNSALARLTRGRIFIDESVSCACHDRLGARADPPLRQDVDALKAAQIASHSASPQSVVQPLQAILSHFR
jgi:hypothetical protein